ncbi:MAG TPA: transporter substrate-binding domain-containing protein, partial [Magnetospirillaceae bacterium]|nr:transporter substrate-binding domain-containing protein [Magnetospirillaceae bacterium]
SYLWTRAGDTLSTDHLAGFKGKTVCVPQGFHSPLLVTLSALISRGDLKIERPDTPEKCVQMLAAGRVDALSGQEAEIAVPIEANHLAGKIVHGPSPLMKLDFHVIFNKDNAALARRFNDMLRLMKQGPG